MEILADEISEGDRLLDYGTAGEVIKYSDVQSKFEMVMVSVGRDEITFAGDEYVRVLGR